MIRPDTDLRAYRAIVVTFLACVLVALAGITATGNPWWLLAIAAGWLATGIVVAALIWRGTR